MIVFKLKSAVSAFNSLTDSHDVANPNGYFTVNFQFPNGFSLKPYIPVPLSGCVHLTLSTRVI